MGNARSQEEGNLAAAAESTEADKLMMFAFAEVHSLVAVAWPLHWRLQFG